MRAISLILVFNFMNVSLVAASETEVREDALKRLQDFIADHSGKEFLQDVYTCAGRDPSDARTCDERRRRPTRKAITLKPRDHAVIIDYSLPSTEKRFFLIDLRTGQTKRFLVAHGKGSGEGLIPITFSNIKDSKQTSLGMYVGGEIYRGSYGETLRMHGLEDTNDQAYNRDIVLHGARYATEKFIRSINPLTGEAYGRLGVSWGCPAVAMDVARQVIPLLKEGGLILHVAR